MIRAARFTDIPRLAELIGEMHARSRYAGAMELDLKRAKAILTQAIQRHGGKVCGSSLVMVAEADGTVEGFIVGMLSAMYDISPSLIAGDWLFYASPRAPARAAGKLLDAVIEWADANPAVIAARFDIGDALIDFERTAKLFQRRGFRRCGASFERGTGDE